MIEATWRNAMNRTLEHERTAQLAYQIWEDEGRPEGRCDMHWLEAERQLHAERAAEAAVTAVSAEGDIGTPDTASARDAAPMRDTRPVIATRPVSTAQAR
jgi:hypothetical protein